MNGERVLLVTDPGYRLDRILAVVRAAGAALGPCGLVVQLRDKTARDVVDDARALREATREVGARLVVNGRWDLAQALAADGVHLPDGDARSVREARARGFSLVTAAVHDDDGVRRALADGADAVLVSPIFATPGKGPPRGVEAIRAARALVDAGMRHSMRVYALGGIDAARASDCAEAGADGVAVIRALLDAADPAETARALALPFRTP